MSIKLSKESKRARKDMAEKLYAGKIKGIDAAKLLGVTYSALFCWIHRHKDEICVPIKTCRNCGIILTDENITASPKGWCVCQECATKLRRQTSRKSHAKTRREVLQHYGTKCVCCGETIQEFLTIDHINGGGTAHKCKIKQTIYQWLRYNKYPDGFQVLCFNCNCAKGIYGECPHKKLK